jgi:hypothetical protein
MCGPRFTAQRDRLVSYLFFQFHRKGCTSWVTGINKDVSRKSQNNRRNRCQRGFNSEVTSHALALASCSSFDADYADFADYWCCLIMKTELCSWFYWLVTNSGPVVFGAHPPNLRNRRNLRQKKFASRINLLWQHAQHFTNHCIRIRAFRGRCIAIFNRRAAHTNRACDHCDIAATMRGASL